MTRNSDIVILRLSFLQTFYYEPINELLLGVSDFVSRQNEELARRATEIRASPPEDVNPEWLIDQLGDDREFLDEVRILSHELAIVALYKKIELVTKSAVKIAFPAVDERSLFKINNLKKELRQRGVDISQIANYAAMDECRCINNSIKHSGTVDRELARYPGWTRGTRLIGLSSAYNRLAPLCAEYVETVIKELMKNRRSASGA